MRSKNPEHFDRIINFIDSYYDGHGQPPEGRQISEALGISRPTVTRYLAVMAADGVIEYDAFRRPVTEKMTTKSFAGCYIPLVGEIACGSPDFADEDIEGYIRLPGEITGEGDFFFLRAKGKSMIDIGIYPGDLVLIRKQNFADPGKIVAALVDGEDATLKRYFPEPENKRVRLHPENSEMEDMYYDDCTVMGVAVKVIHNVE